MESFFNMLSTLMVCGMVLAIATVVALSLPKSRLRTVLTEICGWACLALCAVYAISPIDVIPEAAFGPFGFIDDVGAVYLGYQSYKSAKKARNEREFYDA